MHDRIHYWTTASASPSLHYTVSSVTSMPERARPTLVLLHELGGSVDSWNAVAQFLARRFTVLCADQRGHGLSEKTRSPYTIENLAEDLHAVLSDAAARGVIGAIDRNPIWLLGLAAGAATAAVYAAHHHGVAGVILCCPALEVDAERRDYLETRAQRAVEEGMSAIVEASLARSYPPLLRERLGMPAFEDYRARFLANDPVAYANANRALGGGQARDALAALRLPCLMLAGQHDLLRPPAQVRALTTEHPTIVFSEIDAGHLAAVQAPQALAASVERFIDADGLTSTELGMSRGTAAAASAPLPHRVNA